VFSIAALAVAIAENEFVLTGQRQLNCPLLIWNTYDLLLI